MPPVSPHGSCCCPFGHRQHQEEGSSPAWALGATRAGTGTETAPHLPPLRPGVGGLLGTVGEGRRGPTTTIQLG